MKSSLLLFTPLACLLAQTPPAPQPVTPPLGVRPPQTPAQPPAAPSVPPETVVLTFGDQKITAAEFDKMLDSLVPEQYRARFRTAPGRRQFADDVVNLKLMASEARRNKIDDTPAFKEQLAATVDRLLAQQFYQHLQATAKVDEAAERDYYEAHKSDYLQVKARHILIRVKGSPAALKPGAKELTDEEALAKAKEIRQKLVDGGDFAALAKTESDDSTSGLNGGDLGTFGHGRMTPPFEAAAFSLPLGEISEPVKSQFGYHIIKVESRQEKTFVDVKPEIERKMNADALKKAMDDLKTSANVVYNPDFFGPPAPAPGIKPTASTTQPKPDPK